MSNSLRYSPQQVCVAFGVKHLLYESSDYVVTKKALHLVKGFFMLALKRPENASYIFVKIVFLNN
ncbi:MAG: hypothetical protein OEY87_05735 [Gammaproteobacteria bacterium]|nr:hypothetical protein [Gammaproteobacteria bacterium]MDH5735608.1 hypothetical protein [Gammaproteobacteria bacterium]